MGGAVFPPTNSPISMSGFDGRRAGDLEARDMALPGRGGGRREARGASEDDDDDDDSSEEVDARDCVRVGCVSFEARKESKLINSHGFDKKI
jgi:hypothetical protein